MPDLSVCEKCLSLSSAVLSLEGDFEESRQTRIIYNMLAEQTSELGAAVNAVNYLPLSARKDHMPELVKFVQRVIYNLNLARREGLFGDKRLAEALSLAVAVANDIGLAVRQYFGDMPEGAAPPQSAAGNMPDGFDMPY